MRATKHSRKKSKIIFFSIIAAVFMAVAILAIVNLSVLWLIFSPDSIAISEREESIIVLKELENAGEVRNLEIVGDNSSVSFFSADEYIRVESKYDGAQLRHVRGEINTGRIHISNIEDGKKLVRVMLSPYFTDTEIAAIAVRHSPDIIASALSGNINMSFDIGNNYHVTLNGSANDKVEVGIIVK